MTADRPVAPLTAADLCESCGDPRWVHDDDGDVEWCVTPVGRPAFRAARSSPEPSLREAALRESIDAALTLVPDRAKQFDMGAAAAYNYVLSLLPPPSSPEERES